MLYIYIYSKYINFCKKFAFDLEYGEMFIGFKQDADIEILRGTEEKILIATG